MLLDRPPHVQGRLCNVPPLSEADFDQVSGSQVTYLTEANTFAINAVQLARTGSTSIIIFLNVFIADTYYSGPLLHYKI